MQRALKARWGRITLVWLALVAVVYGLTQLMSCQPAHASAMECPADSGMDEDKAVRAILGEAGASYAEMRAIAWALANRGRSGLGFRGVYGLNRVKAGFYADGRAISPELVQRASRAWFEAGSDNHLADHWLSSWDLAHCRESLIAWRHKMVNVGTWGATTFYKA